MKNAPCVRGNMALNIRGSCESLRVAFNFTLNTQQRAGQRLDLLPGRHFAQDLEVSLAMIKIRGSTSEDLSQTIIVCGAGAVSQCQLGPLALRGRPHPI